MALGIDPSLESGVHGYMWYTSNILNIYLFKNSWKSNTHFIPESLFLFSLEYRVIITPGSSGPARTRCWVSMINHHCEEKNVAKERGLTCSTVKGIGNKWKKTIYICYYNQHKDTNKVTFWIIVKYFRLPGPLDCTSLIWNSTSQK